MLFIYIYYSQYCEVQNRVITRDIFRIILYYDLRN